MEELNKKTNQNFLDKFKGKTNKIDKNGVNSALDPKNYQPTTPSNPTQNNSRKRKLISLDNHQDPKDYQLKQVDLDDLIPTNPQGRFQNPQLSKRSTHAKIVANKLDYVPSLYSPNVNAGIMKIKGDGDNSFSVPPSRSSYKSETLKRRVFGKYLKLDEQAMKHFQFLMNIDRKRTERKNSGVLSQR